MFSPWDFPQKAVQSVQRASSERVGGTSAICYRDFYRDPRHGFQTVPPFQPKQPLNANSSSQLLRAERGRALPDLATANEALLCRMPCSGNCSDYLFLPK
jgi:hypothetical protein